MSPKFVEIGDSDKGAGTLEPEYKRRSTGNSYKSSVGERIEIFNHDTIADAYISIAHNNRSGANQKTIDEANAKLYAFIDELAPSLAATTASAQLSFDIANVDVSLFATTGPDYSHHSDLQASILKSLDSKSASLDKWYEATIRRAETLSFVESKIEAAGLGIGYGGSKLALGFGRFLTSPFYTSAESYDALFKSNQVPVRVLAKNYSQLSAERKIGGFTSLATQLGGGAVVGRAGGAGISGIKNRFLGAPSYASGTPRRPVGAFAAESVPLSPFTQRYLTETGGRWGGASTRAQNFRISQELESRGYTFGQRPGGGIGPEEYIPGPGSGSKGGTYVDITATAPNGRTVRIQTITTETLPNGTVVPTASEAAAAARIRAARPNDKLILVPKGQ